MTTSSRFFGLDIQSPTAWPGQPPIPTEDQSGQPLDPTRPMAVQGNPRWYYKYLRMVLDNGTGWQRTFYLPPRSSTPIMIDRINENTFEVCAWSLYISRPDNQDVVIKTYDIIDPDQVQMRSSSELQRWATLRGVFCQVDSFNETAGDNVTAAEEWAMSSGSALMASGNHYFSIENRGDSYQYLSTIASFNQYDVRDVLESPVVRAHRPWSVNWNNG